MKFFHKHNFPKEVKEEMMLWFTSSSVNDPLATRTEYWGYYVKCIGCPDLLTVRTRINIIRPLEEMWAAIDELRV